MTIRVAEEGGHAEDTTAAPLTGSMGAGKLLFVVLAFSAPMAVVSTFLPFMLIIGGDGATLAFIVSAVLLLLLAASPARTSDSCSFSSPSRSPAPDSRCTSGSSRTQIYDRLGHS